MNIIYPIIIIPFFDVLLCNFFGNKARWFQLHSVINLLILNIIKDDVYKLIIRPYEVVELEEPQELYYICFLHLYHFLFFKNSKMDFIHHFGFVLFGALPIYKLYNLNLIRLATFTGCGLPGFIEYTSLVLVKHNKIKSIEQKVLMSNVYNYFRYPFSVFASSIIYCNHIIDKRFEIPSIIVFYTMFIVYLNGAFFNKITLENTIESFYKIK